MANYSYEKLKANLSECREIEESLWALLNEDKRGHLRQEHSQLKLIVAQINHEISSVDAEQKYFSGIHTNISNDFRKQLLVLEELLVKQHTQLIDIDKLSHEQIVDILNSDKKGKDISQTSQQIQEIEKNIADLIIKFIPPKILDSIKEYELDKVNEMYFDDSLNRIKAKWPDGRHLRTTEYFQILSDKGIAATNLKKDIFNRFGEWFSMAIKIENERLYVVIDPPINSLKRNGKSYDADNITLTSLATIRDAKNLKANSWNENVAEYRDVLGSGCDGIFIPPEGEWWPVGLGGSHNSTFLSADTEKRGSRAVR